MGPLAPTSRNLNHWQHGRRCKPKAGLPSAAQRSAGRSTRRSTHSDPSRQQNWPGRLSQNSRLSTFASTRAHLFVSPLPPFKLPPTMAKSSRSSVKKTNNQKLKKNVFGPVENARAQRLSERLLELAQQPRPAKDEMEVEKDQMELDDEPKPSSSASSKKKAGRVQKKRRGKATSTIAFKNFKTGAKKSGSSNKGRR
ncbi:hypothetical protein IWX48DRAFT_240261 [Phyllosticta citricarpa]